LVFVVVAFPPPPVTFPATRLFKSLETQERLCYLKVDHFLKARLRFYPLSLKTSLATYLEAKPFGFSAGCK